MNKHLGKPANNEKAESTTTDTARSLQIHHLKVRGHNIRVGVWPGDKGRTPLVLFNGIGGRLEMLAPLAEALVGFEVIAFDVPGTGGSSAPRFPYRLWMLSRLVSRVLDMLGYGQVDALGVSWGGALAQQFALQNPRRCRRLVLAATSAGMLMVPGKLSVLLKMVTPRRYNDAAFRDRVVGEIYGGSARAEGGPTRELVAALMRPTSKRGYLAQLFAITGWSSLPWLPMLRQRTLVMAGTDDPIIRPINARLMARLLPRSTLKFFDDGHLFVLSDARQASAAVSDFLNADPAAQGKPLRPVPT